MLDYTTAYTGSKQHRHKTPAFLRGNRAMWKPGCSMGTGAADATTAHTGSKQHQHKTPASGDRVVWEVPRAPSFTLRVEETGCTCTQPHTLAPNSTGTKTQPSSEGTEPCGNPGARWKPALLMLQPHTLAPNSTSTKTQPQGTESCGRCRVLYHSLFVLRKQGVHNRTH